jgi:hypothetical protein
MTGMFYRGMAALWLALTLIGIAWVAGKSGEGRAMLLMCGWFVLGVAASFCAGVEHEEGSDA